MTKMYDVAVIIGRFQPLHNGHLELFKKAIEVADKVIVLIGSANQPRTPKNPWTWKERGQIAYDTIRTDEFFKDWFVPAKGFGNLLGECNLQIRPLHDHPTDTLWVGEVQETVSSCISEKETVCLIKYRKEGDESTEYLNMFPKYKEAWAIGVDDGLNATDIRNQYFGNPSKFLDDGQSVLPKPVYDWLCNWMSSDDYAYVKEEFDCYVKEEDVTFASSPYGVKVITTDAVVFCLGHILLIRRKYAPGKGLWGLPGGHLEDDLSIEENIVEELRQETSLHVPKTVLHGSIKAIEYFSDPNRSLRCRVTRTERKGRCVTFAGLVNLNNELVLPKIRGGDDADKAIWVPVGEFFANYSGKMFEDHFEIATKMNSLLKKK